VELKEGMERSNNSMGVSTVPGMTCPGLGSWAVEK
jgi:hypothetical protein